MEAEDKIPTLLVYLFGESAGAAWRAASPRFLRWCAAFEGWLEERGRRYGRDTLKQSKLAWRRLFEHCRKLPWELRQVDIQAHAAWMQAEGYAPSTIYNALGMLSVFYRWCAERSIDAETEAGFNPAAGVPRPKLRRYAGAQLLSPGELKALLDILSRDHTSLGLRDYAFFLARLTMGVPLKQLRQLRISDCDFLSSDGETRGSGGQAAICNQQSAICASPRPSS
ncbi:MAG TPA: phage integrase N-terminal SAM-like domain-containing protein, partial [Anaerolineales bacterium]|nr:phage integrase N-terminal SAM-like domain-containing protein [Anaerolineales bacterium]